MSRKEVPLCPVVVSSILTIRCPVSRLNTPRNVSEFIPHPTFRLFKRVPPSFTHWLYLSMMLQFWKLTMRKDLDLFGGVFGALSDGCMSVYSNHSFCIRLMCLMNCWKTIC